MRVRRGGERNDGRLRGRAVRSGAVSASKPTFQWKEAVVRRHRGVGRRGHRLGLKMDADVVVHDVAGGVGRAPEGH